MSWFSKPVARVYVDEIRAKLDKNAVAIFTPDISVSVGGFGVFENGLYDEKGLLSTRGLAFEVSEEPALAFEFASQGKVTLAPAGTVTGPGGMELAKASLSFTEDKAVVLSVGDGVRQFVQDEARFASGALDLWTKGEIPANAVVVTEVRRAVGGTVIVSEKRNSSIDLAVPALNAPLGVTIASLKVGATFGVGSEAVWKMATEQGSLTVWVKMLRLSEIGRPGDQYGFDAAPGSGGGSAVAFDAEAYLATLG
jgi:hypothetical protein